MNKTNEFQNKVVDASDGDFSVYIYGDFLETEDEQKYADKLLEWANIWDYDSVKEQIETGKGANNFELISLSDSGFNYALKQELDKDDIEGLFGGKYDDAPKPASGWGNDECSFSGVVYIRLDEKEYKILKVADEEDEIEYCENCEAAVHPPQEILGVSYAVVKSRPQLGIRYHIFCTVCKEEADKNYIKRDGCICERIE